MRFISARETHKYKEAVSKGQPLSIVGLDIHMYVENKRLHEATLCHIEVVYVFVICVSQN